MPHINNRSVVLKDAPEVVYRRGGRSGLVGQVLLTDWLAEPIHNVGADVGLGAVHVGLDLVHLRRKAGLVLGGLWPLLVHWLAELGIYAVGLVEPGRGQLRLKRALLALDRLLPRALRLYELVALLRVQAAGLVKAVAEVLCHVATHLPYCTLGRFAEARSESAVRHFAAGHGVALLFQICVALLGPFVY